MELLQTKFAQEGLLILMPSMDIFNNLNGRIAKSTKTFDAPIF